MIFTLNKKIQILLFIILWCCCTAQQCSGTFTDACGSFPTQFVSIKITPTINISSTPFNVPLPVIQNINNISNAINIQGSLYSPNPKSTMFGVKSVSYALCNSVPRYSSICCLTTNSKTDCINGEENIYQLSTTYFSALRCKITIRAIVDNHEYNNYMIGSFLYEGSIDIDASSTGIIPSEAICPLNYIKQLPFNPGPNPIEFCKFNQ